MPESPAGRISRQITDESTVEYGMRVPSPSIDDEIAALRAIVEGTARSTGDLFFESLVKHLAATIGVSYAFVAEFAGSATHVRTLAYWGRGEVLPNIEFDLAGTPCEDVVRGGSATIPSGSRRASPSTRG